MFFLSVGCGLGCAVLCVVVSWRVPHGGVGALCGVSRLCGRISVAWRVAACFRVVVVGSLLSFEKAAGLVRGTGGLPFALSRFGSSHDRRFYFACQVLVLVGRGNVGKWRFFRRVVLVWSGNIMRVSHGVVWLFTCACACEGIEQSFYRCVFHVKHCFM